MNEIRTHKKTKQRLLLKSNIGPVSTFYILDGSDNKIRDGFDINGNPYHKVVVCLNDNIF